VIDCPRPAKSKPFSRAKQAAHRADGGPAPRRHGWAKPLDDLPGVAVNKLGGDGETPEPPGAGGSRGPCNNRGAKI